jgi:hypothetical protein
MAFADTTKRAILRGYLSTKITLSDNVETGDPLGDSSGTWVRADGNNAVPAALIAGERGASGAQITAYAMAVVGGVAGATVLNPVYLSDTVGKFTETPSTTDAQRLGFSASATSIFLNQIGYKTEFTVSHNFAAAGVANIFFVAPFRSRVLKITVSYATAAGQAGALTVERLQGTEAVTAGDDLGVTTSGWVDLYTTVDTPQSITLTATVANRVLEVNNRLALKVASGAATTLANAVITVHLERV